MPIWPAPRTPLPFSAEPAGEEVSSPCKYASCGQSQRSPPPVPRSPHSQQLYFAFNGSGCLDRSWSEYVRRPLQVKTKAKWLHVVSFPSHTVSAHELPVIKTTAYFRQLKQTGFSPPKKCFVSSVSARIFSLAVCSLNDSLALTFTV